MPQTVRSEPVRHELAMLLDEGSLRGEVQHRVVDRAPVRLALLRRRSRATRRARGRSRRADRWPDSGRPRRSPRAAGTSPRRRPRWAGCRSRSACPGRRPRGTQRAGRPCAAASAVSSATRSIVASRSMRTYVACTAATRTVVITGPPGNDSRRSRPAAPVVAFIVRLRSQRPTTRPAIAGCGRGHQLTRLASSAAWGRCLDQQPPDRSRSARPGSSRSSSLPALPARTVRPARPTSADDGTTETPAGSGTSPNCRPPRRAWDPRLRLPRMPMTRSKRRASCSRPGLPTSTWTFVARSARLIRSRR